MDEYDKRYVPAVILRSTKRHHEITNFVKNIIPKNIRDELGSGVIKTQIIDLEKEREINKRYNIHSKFLTIVYMFPEARDELIKHSNKLLKFRDLKDAPEILEMYYFNKQGELADAFSFPLCVCPSSKEKNVCKTIYDRHPDVSAVVFKSQDGEQTLVGYTTKHDKASNKRYVLREYYRKVVNFVKNKYPEYEYFEVDAFQKESKNEREM